MWTYKSSEEGHILVLIREGQIKCDMFVQLDQPLIIYTILQSCGGNNFNI